jgi:hypothetical protein
MYLNRTIVSYYFCGYLDMKFVDNEPVFALKFEYVQYFIVSCHQNIWKN